MVWPVSEHVVYAQWDDDDDDDDVSASMLVQEGAKRKGGSSMGTLEETILVQLCNDVADRVKSSLHLSWIDVI